MRPKILILLILLFSSIFSQKLDSINSIEKNNLNSFSLNNNSSEFYISLEGNSDLNLCFGDLKGRIAWIPPGISGGVPFNNLEEINEAINNGNITDNPPIVDPLSSGNYFIGPFIFSDDNCDGEFNENEAQMNNISELPAGCYLVYVIDALGNQSEINSISISEPSEILSLIPIINDECSNQNNGSISVEVNGGTPFNVGDEYLYEWSGPNNFSSNSKNISQLSSGNYTLLVKDSNNCMKYFEFDVESIECSFSQTINLNEGWSIISTYINPENTNIESVFNSVVNDIEIIKDENGNVYWPLFGLNSIGDLIIGEGYQIKMNSFNQIIIEGSLIPFDTPISFDEGWNLIGYLHPEDANTVDMMNSIVTNDGPLRILKNGLGNVYWPEFGLNSIGNMVPGQGYQIKMENTTQFSYPSINIW